MGQITPEITKKIRRKNITHAKAKKTGSAKIRFEFEISVCQLKKIHVIGIWLDSILRVCL